MSIQLLGPDNTVLEFQSDFQQSKQASRTMPGANCRFLKDSSIEILIQELNNAGAGFQLSTGILYKRIIAKSRLKERGLYGTFMFENGCQQNIDYFGKLCLGQNSYSLFFGDNIKYSSVLDNTGHFQMLNVFFSAGILKQMTDIYPELNEILGEKQSRMVSNKSEMIKTSMEEIIYQIVNASYDETSRIFYFEQKMKELLFHLLEAAFRSDSSIGYKGFDTSAIYKAKKILESCIGKKPPTLKELAQKTLTSEAKLKKGFRKLFHISIYAWFSNFRLQHAKKLIQTTNISIKEIALLSGYQLSTNFIKSFRKRFGITPGAMRRES